MQHPETTRWEHFYGTHVANADVAFHAMTFAGVYPSDIDAFERAKTEGVPDQANAYHQEIRSLTDHGIRVRRLRVLPAAGEYGYSEADIALMREMARPAARFGGEDVRTVHYRAVAHDLAEHCGEDSPLLQRYRQGLESRHPQAGLWSVRRWQATGELALTAIRLMHYGEGELAQDVLYTQPMPEDLLRFESFWHDVFLHRAEPLPA